ncbi:hypothetical protein CC80DRAFT_197198 [Byssothecium circinans]|uniref:Uncharacterized protein n=1 Tax=Byssothecium circinans TaxID=147558 RepID=A0A6A5UAJ1_9PLEO|nr:hypothetical protein CC80DRAFT_197198 [Byssothecium circinans]
MVRLCGAHRPSLCGLAFPRQERSPYASTPRRQYLNFLRALLQQSTGLLVNPFETIDSLIWHRRFKIDENKQEWGIEASLRTTKATVILRNSTNPPDIDLRCLRQLLWPSDLLSLPWRTPSFPRRDKKIWSPAVDTNFLLMLPKSSPADVASRQKPASCHERTTKQLGESPRRKPSR